jgi:hypothetical protein
VLVHLLAFSCTLGRRNPPDGPTMSAVEAARKNGKVEELHSQPLELAKPQNKSTDVSTSIPAPFLRVAVSL